MTRGRFEDRNEGSAAPWLYGIARNVLLMSIRRGAVERRTAERLGVLERLDLDDGADIEPEAGWAEGADELLDSLPLSQRDALRLRIVDERTYDEVADALRLGDALRQAVAADLGGSAGTQAARGRRRTRPRRRIGTRTAIALVAAALAVPAAAIATGALVSDQTVADSIGGSIVFSGAEPECTTVREGLEYECVVDHDQLINGEQIQPGHWTGVVLGSMDKTTDRVIGGCRSQDAEGTRWLCYIGEESVRQKILMPSALGQYLPQPAGP